MIAPVKGITALCLLSGGRDSALAARLIAEQGITLVGVSFVTPFFGAERAREAAAALGIPLRVVDITEEHLEVVLHPRHGRGSNMNPCIDCHALMLARAGRMMGEEGASFLVTGEVLGQRPMSQNPQALALVERESGYPGLVLRPLSARLLPETVPEREGWVDRSRLGAVSGRSSKPLDELAASLGFEYAPQHGGGCLLTDPGFSRRLAELIEHSPRPTRRDLELLRVGRHFRLPGGAKLVVGRNERENERLQALAAPGDVILSAAGVPGPTCLLTGEPSEETLAQAASVCVRYSDAPLREKGGEATTWPVLAEGRGTLQAGPPDEATLERWRV